MCTVSWLHHEDGYQLLCNRDELLTRREALPPRLERIGGVHVIAPRDGEAGGSWISVNEAAVALCLLNADGRAAHAPLKSRGSLLMSVATSASAWEACERVRQRDLSEFAPFTLVALEPGMPAAIVEWNGAARTLLERGDAVMPLTSSSVNAPRARAKRLELLEQLERGRHQLDVSVLNAFHREHGGQASADSPCMHREDARTVSFSHVTVDPEAIRFQYSPGPPCQARELSTTKMRRVRQAVSACSSNCF